MKYTQFCFILISLKNISYQGMKFCSHTWNFIIANKVFHCLKN